MFQSHKLYKYLSIIAAKTVIHPNYVQINSDNDIALIKNSFKYTIFSLLKVSIQIFDSKYIMIETNETFKTGHN